LTYGRGLTLNRIGWGRRPRFVLDKCSGAAGQFASGADGAVYVSNYGDSNTITSSHPGEIVKITGLP
jgi:hypothetical protein